MVMVKVKAKPMKKKVKAKPMKKKVKAKSKSAKKLTRLRAALALPPPTLSSIVNVWKYNTKSTGFGNIYKEKEIIQIYTTIPEIIINRLFGIFYESTSNMRERSGSFYFSIVKKKNNNNKLSVNYGVNKNRLTGTPHSVNIIANTISYHTHPIAAQLRNLYFTIPSGVDLYAYIMLYPFNQVNLILDAGGIMVFDIDPILSEQAATRVITKNYPGGVSTVLTTNKKKKIYADFVKNDFDIWSLNNTQTGTPIYTIDGTGYRERTNNRTFINLLIAKLKTYGINCALYGWGVKEIPITFDYFVNSAQGFLAGLIPSRLDANMKN